MIQLVLLNGSKAGSRWVARRFPFRIGRSADAHVILQEAGVWEEHAVIGFEPHTGFIVESQGQALILVNGTSTRKTRLRNGDLLECGSVKLRFWLAAVDQKSLVAREVLTWTALAGLFVLQLIVIYRLLS